MSSLFSNNTNRKPAAVPKVPGAIGRYPINPRVAMYLNKICKGEFSHFVGVTLVVALH